ncbi:unnamed protein product [Camellia sinensis]
MDFCTESCLASETDHLLVDTIESRVLSNKEGESSLSESKWLEHDESLAVWVKIKVALTVLRLPVFYKQRDFLFYPPWAFGLPIWVLSIPLSLVESAIWISLTYYTIGFAPDTSSVFPAVIGIVQYTSNVSLSLSLCCCGKKAVVCTLGTCTLIMNILLGGFIVAQNDIEPFMIWGYYISPVMSGQNALVINEFLDKRWSATPRIHAPTVGKVLLKSRGFFTDDYMFWVCVGALLGFSLLFNILFIAALTFLNRKLSHLVIWLNNPVSGCSTSALSDSKSIVLDEDVGKKNKKSSGRMTSEGEEMNHTRPVGSEALPEILTWKCALYGVLLQKMYPLDGSANALAKVMRQRRIDRGALTLASAEVKFQIDTETHDPLDIEANQMVEEFILAANISVAAKILEHFPPFSLLTWEALLGPNQWYCKMGGNASGEESDNIDWDTEDELEIQNFPLSSYSSLTNPGGEANQDIRKLM